MSRVPVVASCTNFTPPGMYLFVVLTHTRNRHVGKASCCRTRETDELLLAGRGMGKHGQKKNGYYDNAKTF